MGFSFAEIALILVVALIVIGPDKLPDMAKSVGKGYSEFKRAFNDLKKSVDVSMDQTQGKGGASSVPNSGTKTYKSRWEEQAAPQPQLTEAAPVPEAAENVQEAEITEVPTRARRGDLIKEENDGNGQG